LLLSSKHIHMKQKFLLLLCIATLGFASCKKDTIIQDTPNRTIILTVQPGDWLPYANGKGYSVDLDIPEIDQLNVDIEGILVYVDHPEDVNSYIQLPYPYAGDSYSYQHYTGGITIDIQATNYLSTVPPVKPTVPIRVKVVLIPSTDVT
jgi:hypothetical protein